VRAHLRPGVGSRHLFFPRGRWRDPGPRRRPSLVCKAGALRPSASANTNPGPPARRRPVVAQLSRRSRVASRRSCRPRGLRRGSVLNSPLRSRPAAHVRRCSITSRVMPCAAATLFSGCSNPLQPPRTSPATRWLLGVHEPRVISPLADVDVRPRGPRPCGSIRESAARRRSVTTPRGIVVAFDLGDLSAVSFSVDDHRYLILSRICLGHGRVRRGIVARPCPIRPRHPTRANVSGSRTRPPLTRAGRLPPSGGGTGGCRRPHPRPTTKTP